MEVSVWMQDREIMGGGAILGLWLGGWDGGLGSWFFRAERAKRGCVLAMIVLLIWIDDDVAVDLSTFE